MAAATVSKSQAIRDYVAKHPDQKGDMKSIREGLAKSGHDISSSLLSQVLAKMDGGEATTSTGRGRRAGTGTRQRRASNTNGATTGVVTVDQIKLAKSFAFNEEIGGIDNAKKVLDEMAVLLATE